MLVAFVILSLALAVLYRGSLQSLTGSQEATLTDEAVARAQSRLAALCAQDSPPLGEQSGNDGHGYMWHSQVTPSATRTLDADGSGQPKAKVTLASVRVTISWHASARPHAVSLESRCLSFTAANH